MSRIYGEGTDFGISALTSFRGDSTSLKLMEGSVLEPDYLGVYTMRRRWKCRRDLLPLFLPGEGDVDFEYPDLKYYRSSITYDAAWAVIATEFNGLLSALTSAVGNNQRIVRSDYDVQLQQLQLTGPAPITVSTPGGGSIASRQQVSITIVYTSPQVQSTYAASQRPSASEPAAAQPDGQCEVVDILGGDVQLTNLGSISKIESAFGVVPTIVRNPFRRVQQGGVWIVTETVSRVLTRTAKAGYKF